MYLVKVPVFDGRVKICGLNDVADFVCCAWVPCRRVADGLASSR